MKLVKRIAFGAVALALCGGLFFSCSNSSDGSSFIPNLAVAPAATVEPAREGAAVTQTTPGAQTTPGTQTTPETQTTPGTQTTSGAGGTGTSATPTYTKIWEGDKTMAWSGDTNCVVIDHADFTAEFNSIRITYNASAGAIKMAACDPWTELKPSSISDGSVADDGALNLPTGDNQTVTVTLSASDVAAIKGQERDGAWGGLKIFGADTVTLKKVETCKNN